MSKVTVTRNVEFRETFIVNLRVGCYILFEVDNAHQMAALAQRIHKLARERKMGVTVRRAREGLKVWKTANRMFYPPKE